MTTPELLEYIRAARAQGLTDEAITQNLVRTGWNPADVQEAIGNPTPQPAAPTPEPAPTTTPPANAPAAAPAASPAPSTQETPRTDTAPAAAAPESPTPNFNPTQQVIQPGESASFAPPIQQQTPPAQQPPREVPGVHMVDEQVSKDVISGDKAMQQMAGNAPYNPETKKGLSAGAWILISIGVVFVVLFIAAAAYVFFNPAVFAKPLSGSAGTPAAKAAATTSPTPAPAHATTTTAAPMIPATTTPPQASSTPAATTTATTASTTPSKGS